MRRPPPGNPRRLPLRERERYAVHLEVAERSGTADATTTEWLRRRAGARPSP
ncbi:MAG: hypothetical protein M3450_06395 [Actinomycetota bacterium]|nr:hypothetical protein [Actinomycetota bacterium]